MTIRGAHYGVRIMLTRCLQLLGKVTLDIRGSVISIFARGWALNVTGSGFKAFKRFATRTTNVYDYR